MNLLISLLLSTGLLSQITSGIPDPSPSDVSNAPRYFDMSHIPAYSAGYSHCEQDTRNPHYYACKPEFISRMAERFPYVEFSGHYLDWHPRDQQYRYHPTLPTGSADPYAGKLAKWSERQNFDTKEVERHLIPPDHKKVSSGNSPK